MNLEKEILKEHSSAQRTRVVNYIGKDKKRFAELVALFFKGPYRLTQLSAWSLSYAVQNHPDLVKPHLKKLIANLNRPGHQDAVKRNTVRLLQFIDIPKNLQGSVTDICFRFLQDRKEAIAIRVFSMTVLMRIAKEQTELKRELIMVIEDQLPFASPAFRSRARRTLHYLNS